MALVLQVKVMAFFCMTAQGNETKHLAYEVEVPRSFSLRLSPSVKFSGFFPRLLMRLKFFTLLKAEFDKYVNFSLKKKHGGKVMSNEVKDIQACTR